jgi:hypothetical protein
MDAIDDFTAILSYKRGEPATSAVYHLTKKEWSDWADRLYAGSVLKAKKGGNKGPMLVSAWLSIRAAHMGWEGLFRKWGSRSKEAGLRPELLDSDSFESLYVTLSKEERFHAASVNFKREYEEVLGYPFRLGVAK